MYLLKYVSGHSESLPNCSLTCAEGATLHVEKLLGHSLQTLEGSLAVLLEIKTHLRGMTFVLYGELDTYSPVLDGGNVNQVLIKVAAVIK